MGFISFLVEPLFKTVAKLLPALQSTAMANLSANKTHYQKLAA